MQKIINDIVTDFSTLTGIACAARPDGTVVVPASDVIKLRALAKLAATAINDADGAPAIALRTLRAEYPETVARHGIPGRAGVDWAAAGRKSWETRRRNAKSEA